MIARLFVSMLPVIFAGALNMIWMKTPFALSLKQPIDHNKKWRDNRALFGENKTWKGFFGMILSGALCFCVWGLVCSLVPSLNELNLFYVNYPNTLGYNFFMGCLLGFAYVLFELPNSFIKRRLGIEPGKLSFGFTRTVFLIVDQIDSLIGVFLVMQFVYPLSLLDWVLGLGIGALIHLGVNWVLYHSGFRKNRN